MRRTYHESAFWNDEVPIANRSLSSLVGLCVLVLSCLALPQPARSAPIVAAYYGSTPGTTKLASLVSSGAAFHLTHLIYAFAGSDASNPCISAPSISASDLQSLKTLKSAGVKILISVGGENSGSEFEQAISANPNFASACVSTLMSDAPNGGFAFDGIDIDWETPGNTADERNFNTLLGGFRTSLSKYQKAKGIKEHLLLTAAITPEYTATGWMYIDFSGQSYPPGAVSSVDFFNIEFYGYAYQGDGITESDAPLYEINADLYGNQNVYGAAKGMISNGKVPPAQIVVGIPFYGVYYTGVTNGKTLQQPGSLYTSGGVVDDYAYYDLSSELGVAYNDSDGKTGCTTSPLPLTCDGIGGAAWIWNQSAKTLWAFDNPETVGTKGRYALAQGLGGLMTWNLMYDTSSGTMLTAMANALRSAAENFPPDFNGNGRSDILLYNKSSREAAIWLMNGGTVSSDVNVAPVAAAYSIVGTGDFNGDGKSDMLLYDSTTREAAIWFMNGGTISSRVTLASVAAGYSIVGTGDFNGDGKSDILLYDSTTREVAIWLMNGGTISSHVNLASVAAGYSVVGTGDFNGDGKSDILLYDSTTREAAIWFMNGGTISSRVTLASVIAGYSIVGTGDFNGDGKSDILLYDAADGEVAIWFMNGGAISSKVQVGAAASPWSIVATSDFNGDGKSDILLYDKANSAVAIWFMNGGTISSDVHVGAVASPWSIVK